MSGTERGQDSRGLCAGIWCGGDNCLRECTGPERIRASIARERSLYAPSAPVSLCGVPDGTERRVDAWEGRSGQLGAQEPLLLRALDRVSGWLVCPGCLGFRFGPTHLGLRWLTGRHG